MLMVKIIKINYNMNLFVSLCVVIMFLQCFRKEGQGGGFFGDVYGGYEGYVLRD